MTDDGFLRRAIRHWSKTTHVIAAAEAKGVRWTIIRRESLAISVELLVLSYEVHYHHPLHISSQPIGFHQFIGVNPGELGVGTPDFGMGVRRGRQVLSLMKTRSKAVIFPKK